MSFVYILHKLQNFLKKGKSWIILLQNLDFFAFVYMF